MDVTLNGDPVRVGKILCVGRNYFDHAVEMGYQGTRDALAAKTPFFFLKPATALVPTGGEVLLPTGIGEVHHEAELAILVGRKARRVPEAEALDHVAGYACFLDVTARDLQAAAKKAGKPWALAKGMDTFAPCGPFVAPDEAGGHARMRDARVRGLVNGDVRQDGSTRDLIHSVPGLLHHASRYLTLEAGDIVATGTPAGVGPLVDGDVARVEIDGLPALEVTARQEP